MNQSIIKRVAITAAAALTLGWATAGLADTVKPIGGIKPIDPSSYEDKHGLIRAVCAAGFTANPAMLDKNKSPVEQSYKCVGPAPQLQQGTCAITKQSFDNQRRPVNEYKCVGPVAICIREWGDYYPSDMSFDNQGRPVYMCYQSPN